METDAGAAAQDQRQALIQRLARIAAWLGGVVLLVIITAGT